jgi:hypothetical protein
VHGADRDVLDEVSAAVLHHDGALNLTWNLPQRTCRRCCGDWRDGCGRSDLPVGGIGSGEPRRSNQSQVGQIVGSQSAAERAGRRSESGEGEENG